MLNDPYPSNRTLDCEARLDAMLAQQETARQKFHSALQEFIAVFDGLDFPICSPVAGLDTHEINLLLADLMVQEHPSDTDIGYHLRRLMDEEPCK